MGSFVVVSLIKIFAIFLCFVEINGISHFRVPSTFHTFKEISTAMPLSPDYKMEVLKPLAQMNQRRVVPLYLIPQTSLHFFPPYGVPTHLPAIEIPLNEPMILGSPESQVVAPVGFTVYSHGSIHPLYTFALLAPVPPGTHVSDETPVIINVLYAVPKINRLPSFNQVITQVPIPSKEKPFTSPSTSDTAVIDSSSNINTEIQYEEDTISIPGSLSNVNDDEAAPFNNAKESIYLQELRLESLQRQVKELQLQITKLKRLRNK